MGRDEDSAPSQPPRPAATLGSKSPRRQQRRSTSRASRPPGSPKRSVSGGRGLSPGGPRAAIAAEANGIGTPTRVSPSPKRKAKRSRTPPAKRTTINAQPEVQPFRPTPLTPIGWDIDAAKAAGAAHPATTTALAPDASNIDDPNNPHAVERRALARSKFQAQAKRRAEAKAKAKGKGRGQGKGRGKSQGGRGGKKANNSRIVFTPPGKGKARGKAKNK